METKDYLLAGLGIAGLAGAAYALGKKPPIPPPPPPPVDEVSAEITSVSIKKG